MSDIFLSIIITFCKQKKYVKRLFESIISQKTNYNYEVLVAIDGPDDGTINIIRQYQLIHKNISLFTVNSDTRLLTLSRASQNRLFLLEKSRGKYFCILDGDDFYINYNRFQVGIDFLENNSQYIGHACGRKNYFSQQDKYEHFHINRTIFDFHAAVTGEYIHVSQCIFHNIFKENNITYFNPYFFNDRSILRFMTLYNPLYYNDEAMFAYRLEVPSIYSSQSKVTQKIMHIAAHITNRELGMQAFFEKKAAYELLYLLLKSKKLDKNSKILDSIIFQNIPILTDFARSIKSDDTKLKIKLYIWCIQHLFIIPIKSLFLKLRIYI